MLQVVFHLNEESKWSTVFSNATNLLKAAPATTIKIVVNGAGVLGYFSTELYPRFQALTAQGMAFYACEQALKGQEKTPEDLPPEIAAVPSGVLYLAQLQHEGFSYIKP